MTALPHEGPPKPRSPSRLAWSKIIEAKRRASDAFLATRKSRSALDVQRERRQRCALGAPPAPACGTNLRGCMTPVTRRIEIATPVGLPSRFDQSVRRQGRRFCFLLSAPIARRASSAHHGARVTRCAERRLITERPPPKADDLLTFSLEEDVAVARRVFALWGGGQHRPAPVPFGFGGSGYARERARPERTIPLGRGQAADIHMVAERSALGRRNGVRLDRTCSAGCAA